MTNENTPTPPTKLGEAGRSLWHKIVSEYVLEPDNLILLDQACRTADRVAEAESCVTRDGMTVADRWGQLKPHPGCELELKYRRLLKGLLRDMGLHIAAEEYARPNRLTTGPKAR